MRKRGLKALVVATETFRPLVLAQAKARKLDPHLVVVKHPVGGLNAAELVERIEAAFAGFTKEVQG